VSPRRRPGAATPDELVLFPAEQFDALLTTDVPEAATPTGGARAAPTEDARPRRGARSRRPTTGGTAVPDARRDALPDPLPEGPTDAVAERFDDRFVYSALVEESIPGASPASAVDVSTLTQTVKDVLEGAFVPLWVRGEVCDFKAHRNGHWYFALRDGRSQVRCVVWARDQRRIPAPPDEGMQVAAFGQVTVYPGRGELQFTVRAMEAEGDGLWRKALEQTLARLNAAGLLDPARKRPIPRYPRRVAVVTSPSGAALHDIVSVVRRRCATVEIVVVAAKVQGEGAPEELCAAIERVGRWVADRAAGEPVVDVVIVGRGGGAREDLWAFNDERVARAVAACPVPVISAVGHEVDVTLCDLVADLRAATPSAAAEAAVPVRADLLDELRSLGASLTAAGVRCVERRSADLALAARDFADAATRVTDRRRVAVEQVAARLHALSPLATLGRGYAVARSTGGDTLGSARHFAPGMPFHLLLRDGAVRAVTEAVERGKPLVAAANLRVDDAE
jgi:exodeoxyribonuclease VII large subunit